MHIPSSGRNGLDACTHGQTKTSLGAFVALATLGLALSSAHAASSTPNTAGQPAAAKDNTQNVAELKRQIDDMRQQYEARLKQLESKLDEALQAVQQPAPTSAAATATPSAAPVEAPATAAAGSASGFNPAVSLILTGTYASLSKDPDTWKLSGFIPGGDEIGPGPRGFNLGESELSFTANIDPWWYGALTVAITPDDTISAEEAFVQTTALPAGMTLKVGRFFSGLGYLNEQHSHTWDFVDAPLAYQAFVGGQYKQEGAQLKWLAPTDAFLELGAELGNGHSFPGNDRSRNSAGSVALFAHTGGDIGDSHSWRAGLSWLGTKASDRAWDDTDINGNDVSNAFTGNSRMWVADAVWKWAPHGNGKVNNFKLQGEYFRRTETGEVAFDTANTGALGDYRSVQSGWYLQGIYQFTTGWRVGLRHDQLDSGTVDYGLNSASMGSPATTPKRDSLMLDWSPSEFSRWRLQVSDDRSREGVSDRQLFLQYQMSLGAHGAHSY